MKKTMLIILVITIIICILCGAFILIFNKGELLKKNPLEEKKISKQTEEVVSLLTLDDEVKNDTVWCGTFQLIWNDLKNELAKQDIVFNPQLDVVKNLNKETFKISDISDEAIYKKYGSMSKELKEEIEKGIKEKFNEKSDILDDFNWKDVKPKDYFLYAMLKKEFKFEVEFQDLGKGNFGKYENVNYFGISKDNENSKLRNQVKVLYYNSKEDFAIKLITKQKDEVILCKNPKGKTFSEIYQNIENNKKKYKGDYYVQDNEIVKIPNIMLNIKDEFTEIQDKEFEFSNGDTYKIIKAIQTIKFELDKTGGKIKSEAGMGNMETTAIIDKDEKEIREFVIDDTFAIFLKENDKDKPYFAGNISDITKFQE